MPATKSVLQDWVMNLPLRHQGVLVVALRGCDVAPKLPLNSIERRIVAAIRGHVLNAFDPREIDVENGSFMSMKIPWPFKLSCLEHYPMHWVLHVVHAIQVLGYYYPDEPIRCVWHNIYRKLCEAMHIMPEYKAEMDHRLTEDRIASGEVVS